MSGDLQSDIAEALAGGVAVRKRSVVLAGHRTSLSLEDAFWRAAREEAAARGLSVNALVEAVDRARTADPAEGVSGGLSTVANAVTILASILARLPGAEAPDREIAQACLASLDVDASPERPEAAADEG